MRHIRKTIQTVVAVTLLAYSGAGQAGLIFNISGTGNASADAGFAMAASILSNLFTDNVTVNVNAGFANLDPGILGSASSTFANYGFVAWKGNMAADSTTADDATMVAGLPGGPSFSVYINRTSNNPNGSGSATAYVDNDGDANNTTVNLTNANAKALGLLAANATAEDAAITFSSNFTWDFDPTDGITAGAIDFVGVAIHELMHAMGFISGVDVLDINSPPVNGPFSDDLFTFVSGLDFTRMSVASLAAGADIDWTVDALAKMFSIDGGATALIADAWSLGRNFGDGQQASHWRDNLGIGIMDPTSQPAGTANMITAFDLQALDVIGWNTNFDDAPGQVVPEPGTLALLGLGLAALGLSRRRTRTKR